ncbi:MAG: T9SS type A sorting domain-containing protein, partial [Caldithrix sp.]|nr:T9SS type A sorting domain-containing protein [Caldithrix sp.]
NSVSTSVIEVESVNGNPGGTPPSGISSIATSHYYTVTEEGTGGTFTYNFTGHYLGTGFSPETRNQLLRQTGTGPTYAYDNTTDQTVNTTDNTVKINDALSALPTNDGIFAFGSGITSVAWDGEGSDNNWSTLANWVGDQVPASGDAVLLDNSSLTSDYEVVYDGDVSQTTFESIRITSGASYEIKLTLEQATTIDLQGTSNVLEVGSTDTLVYSGTSITMGGASYDPSLTTFNSGGYVKYLSGSVYVDAYGNLYIDGATGTSGSGSVSVTNDMFKDNSNAFSSDRSFTVSGTYTNYQGNATYNGGLTVNGNTFTVENGTIGGSVTLSGSSSQSIEGGGSTISIDDLTIDNSNNVTLNNSVIIAGQFTFTSGLLNTTTDNLLTISSTGSISGSSSSRYVNGPMAHSGTGGKFYPLGDAGDYRPLELVSLTGTDPVIRFEMVASNPGGTAGSGLNNISNVRYWQGSRSSGTISNCQVKLYWGEDDNVDGSLDDLAVATSASQSGTYTSEGNTGTTGSTTSGTVTSGDLVDMQYFTLGSQSGDNSLPVELASFEAQPSFNAVLLEWTTASELNNMGFNIYRKKIDEDNDWQKINSDLIAGQGTISSETDYRFTDDKVQSGLSYQYRVESVSFNGKANIEKEIEVTVPMPQEYVLAGNYPNPFNPTTSIRFRLPETQNVTITIYDASGRTVRHLADQQLYSAGEHNITWDARDDLGRSISSGIYLYRLQAGSFTAVSKMIFMK